MTALDENPWIASWPTSEAPAMRLLCFPHAGAGAGRFRPWARLLPASVEVCALRFPGRESRLTEPPVDDLRALVEALVAELPDALDMPYAVFGECSGTLVAFELVRRLIDEGRQLPLCLFGSACQAPQVGRDGARLHELPFDQMIDRVGEFGGIDRELLDEPDLLELIEPTLRADLRMVETWSYAPAPPLPVPISLFGGLDDRFIAPEELLAWREQTTCRFSLRLLEGDHFVAMSAAEAVTALLVADLELIAAAGAEQAPL